MKTTALLALSLLFTQLATAQLEFALWSGGGVALVDYQALDNDLTAHGYPETNEGMFSAHVSIQLKKPDSRWAGNLSFGSSSQSDRTQTVNPAETESWIGIKNTEVAYGADFFLLNKRAVKVFPGLSMVANQTTVSLLSGLPYKDNFNSLLNADIRSDKFTSERLSLMARMNVGFGIPLKSNLLTLGLHGAYQFGRKPNYWRYDSEDGPLFFLKKRIGETYYIELTAGYRWISRSKGRS